MNLGQLLFIVLIVLLVFALGGGYYGTRQPRNWGAYGWSPAGIILIVLLCLWLTGNLHGCQVPR